MKGIKKAGNQKQIPKLSIPYASSGACGKSPYHGRLQNIRYIGMAYDHNAGSRGQQGIACE